MQGLPVPLISLSREIAGAWTAKPNAGKGMIAVPAVDEDVVTMAVEAATAALGGDASAAREIDALIVASSSSPFASVTVSNLSQQIWPVRPMFALPRSRRT